MQLYQGVAGCDIDEEYKGERIGMLAKGPSHAEDLSRYR